MSETNISKEQKRRILKRDNNKCVLCFREYQLQIHHYYDFEGNLKKFNDFKINLPYEKTQDHDLVTLCASCHGKIHTCSRASPIYQYLGTYLKQFYVQPIEMENLMKVKK